MQPRLTVSIPIFGRPQRTVRAINCILNQDITNWEAFIIGDCCHDFEKILRSDWYKEKIDLAKQEGNRIITFNYLQNYGGCGYAITNYAITLATGKYFIFFANDDVIEENHFRNYLNEIENTDYDFVYFNGNVRGEKKEYKLRYGHIGHDALIIETDFLKKMPPHSKKYGHDFDLIKNMIKGGSKFKHPTKEPTYKIMSNLKHRIDLEGID